MRTSRSCARCTLPLKGQPVRPEFRHARRPRVSNRPLTVTSPWVTAKPGAVVVVPAHNEFAALARCVDAVRTAAIAAARSRPPWSWCSMRATTTVPAWPGNSARTCASSRSMNAMSALRGRPAFAMHRSVLDDVRRPPWYATTDADTEVGSDWLMRQIASGADMVLGLVRVGQWRHHSEEVARSYTRHAIALKTARQQHIHGANMGFRLRGVLARRRLRGAGQLAKMSTWSSDFKPRGIACIGTSRCG